jgi:feruloyl-CoA synthase
MTSQAAGALPPFRPLPFRDPDVEVTRGGGGTVYLRSRTPLAPQARSIPHLLDERAAQHPGRAWLKQRTGPGGDWREITYGEAADLTRRLAQGLIDRGLNAGSTLLILSANSIEHALISIAAQRIGVAATPVSPAYALLSSDHARLKHCFNCVKPAAVFVQDPGPFASALHALPLEGVLVLSAAGGAGSVGLGELAAEREGPAVSYAMDRLRPETVGKYLFTSGSTGMPKPAPQTQGAMTAQVASLQGLEDMSRIPDPGVIRVLDWMPWSHISGGNVNFHRCLAQGGVFHIDEGRPLPGAFDATIANLREVRPQTYGSAPVAFGMLAEAMETDASLRDAVFAEMIYLLYGGATLSDDLYGRIQKLAIEATGKRIPLLTMYGATETQGITMTHWILERVGMVGLPMPGLTLKLAPVGDKLEVRAKGPTVMSGYLGLPEKNADAFDEEGFYRLGDAARFEDPAHPERGLVFDGRVTEDFKLSSGTWVSVGTLRPAVVAACTPLVLDAVICGQDKPYVGALVWPAPGAMKAAIEAAGGDAGAAVRSLQMQIEERVRLFNVSQTGSSRRIERVQVLTTPPSMDAGEITDKGYVNQRRAQELRADAVAALFG